MLKKITVIAALCMLVISLFSLPSFAEDTCGISISPNISSIEMTKGGSEKLKAKAYYSLGTTYFKRKKYDLAEQNYQEAFKRGDPEYLLFALGCVKICRGEYAKSLDYLYACSLKREEMYLDMPFHPKLGEIFALIGDVYTLMGLPVKAVKFYVRALYVYEGIDRVSKTSEYKTTLEKLYKTFSALGEKERAESYKRRAEQA